MQAVSFESERPDETRLSHRGNASNIVRGKSSFLSNFGEHYSSDFFAVMKSEHVIAVLRMIQFDVGTFLRNDLPALAEQGTQHHLGFCASPLTQADTGKILIECGMSFDFSTSSATAYKANA